MNILFDTNVLLDVLLSREPWFQDGYTLWQYHDQGKIKGYITATTLTDIFYVSRRYTNPIGALEAVKSCLNTFVIISVGRDELEKASEFSGKDFEDNLQIACANLMGLDAIVTRNTADFAHSPVPTFTPTIALQKLNAINH